MIYVVKAEYLRDFIVSVTFNDGLSAELDLGPMIKDDTRAIVRQLLDVNLFARLTVDADTIVWPNGFDLAPRIFVRTRSESPNSLILSR